MEKKRKARMTAKWMPMLTTWSNELEREVPDSFSRKHITLEVGIYGFSKEECYKMFSELEDRLNEELEGAYGRVSFDRCSEYGVPDEGALLDTVSWERCHGQTAEQKEDIMQEVKEIGKKLLGQHLRAGETQGKEKNNEKK